MLKLLLDRARAAAAEAAAMIGDMEGVGHPVRVAAVVVSGFAAMFAAEYLLMLSDYELSRVVPLRHALARPVVTIALVAAWSAGSWGWERLTWCGFYPRRVWHVLRYGPPTRLLSDDKFIGEE